MIIEVLSVGPLECNCIVLACDETRQGIVIDPGGDPERILDLVERGGMTAVALFLTHAHLDHVGGVRALKQATGAPILLHANDLTLYEDLPMQGELLGVPLKEPPPVDRIIGDNDEVSFGRERGVVVHTPGHSPGSVGLWFPDRDLLASGDTLFQGGIGRTDLWGGSLETILRSIRERIFPLGDETRILPGHGPETTVGHERRYNPFLLGGSP